MKILFPFDSESVRPGGVTGYVQSLLRNVDGGRYTIYDSLLRKDVQIRELREDSVALRLRRKWTVFKTARMFGNILKRGSIDLVFLNPSLGPAALKRDMLYAQKSIDAGAGLIVFFHGWNKEYEKVLDESGKCGQLLECFGGAKAVMVLASEFKDKLVEWGFDEKKIIIETTMVEDSLVKGFDIEEKLAVAGNRETLNILFISRIVKEKGIYQALDAYDLLKGNNCNLRMTIAGDGPELGAVMEYVSKHEMEDIEFTGFVTGAKKQDVYRNADVLVFPTYSEGMPITVLEAMAFGVPVITRPVGGVRDFFEDEKMGYITESFDPAVYADLMGKLVNDPEAKNRIARYNHQYANDRFLASKVARRMEKVFDRAMME